jgi:hypothetical protein
MSNSTPKATEIRWKQEADCAFPVVYVSESGTSERFTITENGRHPSKARQAGYNYHDFKQSSYRWTAWDERDRVSFRCKDLDEAKQWCVDRADGRAS